MAATESKGAFVERVLFALCPLLISGVFYLLLKVNEIGTEVATMQTKVTILSGADVAREKLRADLEREIQTNHNRILENSARIDVLDERVKFLKSK
jgi:hypothetical protein